MLSTLAPILVMAIILGFDLYVLWRLIASRSGIAWSSYLAAYLILASIIRLAYPASRFSPAWAPLLYPHAWLGITACIWAGSQLRLSRHGARLPARQAPLAMLFISLIAMHLGLIASSPFTHGSSLGLYLMVPPAMVLLTLLMVVLLSLLPRREPDTLPWSGVALVALLVPAAWLKLCTALLPQLLHHL